jgi:tetratricopeptide (TPR) repeat protein
VASGLRDASNAESVYALATLEMVAPSGAAGGPAQRLRQNGWIGGLPGKGRAALVYALVRAGDVEGASGELEKLSLLARPHPALAALRALVDHSRQTIRPAPPPKRDKHTTKLCPDDLKLRHGDVHAVIRDAVNARCRGDIAGSRRLYESIVDVSPGDPEALSGLGDLARLEDDWDTARNFYAEALRAAPSFLPAAIGAADVEWDLGNLPVAQRKYRDIIETFPDATYPPRVAERAAPVVAGAKGSG